MAESVQVGFVLAETGAERIVRPPIGAQMALLSETERMRAFELAERIEHVALATQFEFQEIFVEGMNFSVSRSDPSEAS